MGSYVVADFETTTDPEDCRVWGWAVADVDSETILADGINIRSFLDFMSTGTYLCYFHNLAFDGSFIIDFLLKHNFTYTDERYVSKRHFTTLISDDGKFYTITVRWQNGKRTEFRDSLKKLPMRVKDIAESFTSSRAKGSIDYNTYRPVGHELTLEETEYLYSDVLIVAAALKQQLGAGMTKLTVGSDSLAEFKRLYSDFNVDFPVLTYDIDADIRKAYRGGFTYTNPKFKIKSVGCGKVYDVNSLYPYVMRTSLLPYGTPIWRDGMYDNFRPLFIASITFTARLKPDHVPCIQLKANMFYRETEYQTIIDEPVTLFASNVDLELWHEHYDMNILEYHGAWYFEGKHGIFDEYVDKWSEIKSNSTGGMRTIAKLHLNSLYGKFATNPDVTSKYPVMENDIVVLKTGEEETREPVYTAMGVFITSYARAITIRAAQAHYHIFAYADTDSLHLITTEHPKDLDIHPTKLGSWKHEYDFVDARFVRPKCYIEKIDKCNCETETEEHSQGCGFVSRIAGLPLDVSKQLTFDDITNGRVFRGKLAPKRVPGGIVLTDVGFTMKF